MGIAILLIPAKLHTDCYHLIATDFSELKRFGCVLFCFFNLLKFLDICLASSIGSLEKNPGKTLHCVTKG